MLLAWLRRLLLPAPEPTQERPSAVREKDLDALRLWVEERLSKQQQQFEWEMGEWYDKFSTLHARASKRQQRSSRNGDAPTPQSESDGPRPSVLNYRKPWSV